MTRAGLVRAKALDMLHTRDEIVTLMALLWTRLWSWDTLMKDSGHANGVAGATVDVAFLPSMDRAGGAHATGKSRRSWGGLRIAAPANRLSGSPTE